MRAQKVPKTQKWPKNDDCEVVTKILVGIGPFQDNQKEKKEKKNQKIFSRHNKKKIPEILEKQIQCIFLIVLILKKSYQAAQQLFTMC